MSAASALATATGAAAAPTTATRIDAGAALACLIYSPELDEAVQALIFNAGAAPTYPADPNPRPLEAAHLGLVGQLR